MSVDVNDPTTMTQKIYTVALSNLTIVGFVESLDDWSVADTDGIAMTFSCTVSTGSDALSNSATVVLIRRHPRRRFLGLRTTG